jgi:hypothetical protein
MEPVDHLDEENEEYHAQHVAIGKRRLLRWKSAEAQTVWPIRKTEMSHSMAAVSFNHMHF